MRARSLGRQAGEAVVGWMRARYRGEGKEESKMVVLGTWGEGKRGGSVVYIWASERGRRGKIYSDHTPSSCLLPSPFLSFLSSLPPLPPSLPPFLEREQHSCDGPLGFSPAPSSPARGGGTAGESDWHRSLHPFRGPTSVSSLRQQFYKLVGVWRCRSPCAALAPKGALPGWLGRRGEGRECKAVCWGVLAPLLF